MNEWVEMKQATKRRQLKAPPPAFKLTFIEPIWYAIVDDARHSIARYTIHVMGGARSLAVVDVIVVDQHQRISGGGWSGGGCIVIANCLGGHEASVV